MPRVPLSHRIPERLAAMRQLAIGAAIVLGAAASALSGIAEAATPTSPPPVTILSSSPFAGLSGDFFITPTGDASQYANGPEIVSPSGAELWFQALPQGETAADFRVQRLYGQPVLTYWEGVGLGGLSNGTDYILNNDYQQIATVNAGNGLTTDGHEFLITPWNTALILSYVPAIANLTSIGGPANQLVVDGVVQEINVRTGRVLSSGTAPITSRTARASSRCRAPRAARGIRSTSTRSTSGRTTRC